MTIETNAIIRILKEEVDGMAPYPTLVHQIESAAVDSADMEAFRSRVRVLLWQNYNLTARKLDLLTTAIATTLMEDSIAA